MSIQKTENNISLSSVIKQENLPGPASERAEDALIEAGRNLSAGVAEMTEKNLKVNEQILSEGLKAQMESRTREAEPEESSRTDQASLSEKSLRYRLSGEDLLGLLTHWTLEQIPELWDSFLNWQPAPNMSLTEKVKFLNLLYQKLLDAVLSNTSGIEQTVQLNRLNEALQSVLIRLMESDVSNLNVFLGKYGEESSYVLKLSIFMAVTGRSPEPGELKRFFSGTVIFPGVAGDVFAKNGGTEHMSGKGRGGTGFQTPGTGLRKSGREAEMIRGSIYKVGDRGKIVEDSRFGAERVSQGRSGERPILNHGGRNETAMSGGFLHKTTGNKAAHARFFSRTLDQKLYSASDLEKTERFASHIEREGNLFEKQGLSGKSEELQGVLASVMDIKAQTFMDSSKISTPMKTAVRSAMDRLIDHYIFRAGEYAGQTTASFKAGSGQQPFSQKAAYQVYHYVMNLYQKNKEPRDAVSKGVQYAYEQFHGKQTDEAYQDTARYQKQAGFFQEYAPRVNQQQREAALLEWKTGKTLFDEDWRNFIRALGREGRQIPPELLGRGLWALAPAGRVDGVKRVRDRWLLIGGIAGAALVSALVLWLR